MLFLRSLLIATISSLYFSTAQAHNFWLLPSSTILSKTAYITIDAAVSNDLFYFNYVPLRLTDGLSITAPDGQQLQPENRFQGKLRSVFDLNLSQTGTYRVALRNNYLRANWKEGNEIKRFRGAVNDFPANIPANATEIQVSEHISNVETFITVGKPTPLRPTGTGLELIAVTHPNDLYAGERAAFILHVDGKPAKDIKVTIIRGGTRYRNQLEEIQLSTNEEGKVSITWPQAGMYWLEAQTQDAQTSSKHAAIRKLTYVATLEIQTQ